MSDKDDDGIVDKPEGGEQPPTPETYTVGYGRPPREHQFKPKQSGNPKGRPKGVKNLRTDLEEELAERVELTEGGRLRKLTKQRALIKAQVNRGIARDARAADRIFDLLIRVTGLHNLMESGETPLTADERAVLETLEARLLRRLDKAKKSDGEGSGS
jgi:hypothetical protein